MTKEEQVSLLISQYMNVQRVIKAQDKEKELANQQREIAAKLEAMGVVTEKLIIE